MEKPPQIFISYSSKDRSLIEKIHLALEAAGFNVWRDQTRLETDWSREIAMALADADAICLMWSPNSAASEWVRHEWLTGRALEKRIIPCLLPDAPELPKPLFHLHGVSFKEFGEGCEKLIARLKSVDQEPVHYDYTILPENSYIPFNPNPHFIGRQRDLLELYLKMIGNLNHIGINQVGTVGMGGIGKTQLAVEFAYRFSFGFEGVYWIQAADKDRWLAQFVDLVRDRLQLSIPDPESAQASKQYIFALQKFCKAHPNILIVMDNVTEPKFLNHDALLYGLTPLTLGCNLLFTTRKKFQIPGVGSQAVDILSSESALALLTTERQLQSLTEREKAREICDAVGNLPLALTLAAGYLKAYPEVSFADYYEELRRNKLDTLDLAGLSPEELATRHEAAVGVTLQNQWRMLSDENAKHLFRLAGLFPEAEIIPKARLALLSGIPSGSSILRRPLDQAFNLLYELSLVEKLDIAMPAIRLHPLVHDFSSGLFSEANQIQYKDQAAKVMRQAYFEYSCLESELRARGVNQVIEDMEVSLRWQVMQDANWHGLRLLRAALRLSANQLTDDKQQLAPHLVGRLLSQNSIDIQNLLRQTATAKHRPWLRPLTCSLVPPGGPLLRTLERFLGSTSWAVAFDVTGHVIVSASIIHERLEIWDLKTGEVIGKLTGDKGFVTAVALSTDGQVAVTAFIDGTLKIWDIQLREVIRTLKVRTGPVTHVALTTTDGHTMIGALSGKTVKLWSIKAGRVIRTRKTHISKVNAIAMSPKVQIASSVSGDGTLKIWNLKTGEAICKLRGHTDQVTAIAITTDGQTVVSASADKTLKVWNLKNGQEIRTLEGHADRVTAIAVSVDGQTIVSSSDDKSLRVWNLKSGQEIHLLEGHAGNITAVALTADGQTAASASYDNTIKVWNLKTKVIRMPEGHKEHVTSVAITPNGRTAISASRDGTLKIWKIRTGEVICEQERHARWVNTVAITPDGKTAISTSGLEGTLKVWNLRTGEAIRTLKVQGFIHAIAIAPKGTIVVSVNSNKTLQVWNLETGKILCTRKGHTKRVTAMALTANGQIAVSASENNIIKVWNLKTGELRRTLKVDSTRFTRMAISADGKTAIFNSNRPRVWNLEAGEAVRNLGIYFLGGVAAVAMTPDGRTAVSASRDKTLNVWDIETGDVIASFIGESEMEVCAVAQDGKTIVAGEASGRVHFFRLEGLDA